MPFPRCTRAIACAQVVLLVAACEPPPPGDPALVRSDDPVGICSFGEAFEPTVTGLTNYVPGAEGGTFLLTCITPGPTGTMVTIAIPGVAALPDTGVYQVRRSGAHPSPPQPVWAEVHLSVTTPTPAHYLASGGQLRIRPAPAGLVEGSYELALDRAPETDPRYPAQMAVRGTFLAPRLRDDS